MIAKFNLWHRLPADAIHGFIGRMPMLLLLGSVACVAPLSAQEMATRFDLVR